MAVCLESIYMRSNAQNTLEQCDSKQQQQRQQK